MLVGVVLGLSINVSAEEGLIPSWIKTTAGFWVDDQISDSEFIAALQYLVEQDVLIIPEKDKTTESEKISLFTSGTGTYTNTLYSFTLNYPKNWNVEEYVETVEYGQAAIVGIGPVIGSSYDPSFVVHFFSYDRYTEDLVEEMNEQELLEYYSNVGYQIGASQVKFLDQSIERLSNGYKLTYTTTDVAYFPADYINGEWIEEEYIPLVNEYVIFYFFDGEEYDLLFSSHVNYFDEYIDDFRKVVDSFKRT